MPRGSKNLACGQLDWGVDLTGSGWLRVPRFSKAFDGSVGPVESSFFERFRPYFCGPLSQAPRRSSLLWMAGIVLLVTIPAFRPAEASDSGRPAAALGQVARDGNSASAPSAAEPSPGAVKDADRSHSVSVVPTAMPARVLIRYLGGNSDAARRAHDLAKALIAEGIEVSDVRDSVAALRTELRFFYVPDEATAQMVGHLAAVMPVRFAFAEDDLMPRPGTIQLTISGR